MTDQFYPTVNYKFLEEKILSSPKIIPGSKVSVGGTTTFTLKGTQNISKRLIHIRQKDSGEVSYEQATGLAIRFQFIGSLMKWLEVHKNWKEGAYVVPDKETN